MEFIVAYHTDAGIRKKVNQDALLIKTARSSKGKVGLFVVCDGMGGLSRGELASATVIKLLSTWFDEELPSLLNDNTDRGILTNLEEYLKEINERILEYGEKSNVKIGTTLTAFLVLYDKYYIFQVGDSRVYKIDKGLEVLTNDQTLVAREVKRGNMTEEEGKNHPNRNVLLQCIGATKRMKPDVTSGIIKKDSIYMLCTDGFYHEILEEEIIDNLKISIDKDEIERKAVELVELVKSRGEIDNITVLVIKTKESKGEIV